MRYGTVDRGYALRLATCPPEEDGPVLMVNFMRYREQADYGTNEGAGGAVSGREADDRYAPLDVLDAIGARVVFYGDVVGPPGSERWDRVGIVRYPTRRSFVEMQSRSDFRERHVHKEAGMEFTINMTAVPTRSVAGDGDGSGVVRFVAWPDGGEVPGDPAEGAVLSVEGRVIGDERRWSHVGVHWSDELGDPPPGAILVSVVPRIDQLREVIDGWHRG